jgi:hypothetical protein
MTGLRLCFVPAPVSSIAVDDPRRTRCVSIVQHNLKTVVLIGGVLVRPITEEACRIIFLAHPIGHAREHSIFLALRPINSPIKLVIYSRTATLLEIVVGVMETLTGPIGLRIQVDDVLTH